MMIKSPQNTLAASAVLLLAVSVAWLSHTQEPAGAFLFPRLISLAFVGLAAINLASAMFVPAEPPRLHADGLKNLLPGLAIIGALIFFAAKSLGFYLASTLAFFALFSLYDHASHQKLGSWLRRALLTAAFMLVMYGLFAVLLQVQTPRGIAL